MAKLQIWNHYTLPRTNTVLYTCTVNISLCMDCNPYNTHPPQNDYISLCMDCNPYNTHPPQNFYISLCIDCNPYNTHPPQNNAGVRSPRHHVILLSVHSDGPDLVLMLVHRRHTGVGLDDPQLDQAVRSAAENIVSKLTCILN